MQSAVESIRELTHDLIHNASPGGAPQILVVDDDPGVALSLTRAWQSEGVEVTLATGGREAIQAYNERMGEEFWKQGKTKHPFDIVLLDLKMPVIDGVEVLTHIRNCWKNQPVVIVTGALHAYDLSRLQELGYIGLIEKPVEKTTLRQVLEGHNLDGVSKTTNNEKTI